MNDVVHLSANEWFEQVGSRSITFDENLLDAWSGSLLIVGPAGSGKTSFCRWHALADCESFSSGSSRVLPVYVPLKQLSESDLTSFEQAFLRHLGVSALLTRDEGDRLPKWRVLRVYLDRLDEISSSERQARIVQLARTAAADNNRLQVIITARDYDYGPILRWLPKLHIESFSDEQIRSLAEKWLDCDEAQLTLLFEQVKDLGTLQDLMKVPLLATLVILVFRQTRKIPENRARLYDMFVHLLSVGWDLIKGVQRPTIFDAGDKLLILSRLAFRLQREGLRQFGERDIETTIQRVWVRSPGITFRGFRDEILRDGIVTASGGTFEFAHFSFQEFLAAKDLVGDPLSDRLKKVLDEYLRGRNWWKEVLWHYIGLSGRPRELKTWLKAGMRTVEQRERGSATAARGSDQYRHLMAALRFHYPNFRLEA